MQKIKEKTSILGIVLGIVLGLYVISMILPLLWMVLTTLKSIAEYEFMEMPNSDRLGNILWWPREITFKNYATAYKYFYIDVDVMVNGKPAIARFNIFQQFINSILFSVGSALAFTITSMVMGYATARFKYKFSEFIYGFVLVTLALPIVGSMPSEIATSQALGFFDTFWGIWIMRSTFLNTYFLIFYAQFKMIPHDYTEAAKIDGATPLAVMVQIIMPLAAGTTSAVFVLNFIALWNDFQIPMVYLPSHPVAAYGMYQFQNTAIVEIAHTPTRLAGICLMTFPIVVFYAIFNKKLNVNLSVGGIKG
ncbi:MAG: carbohydrate ABC transporter permease [Clostridiales bacterium]|nr:carbohydrate ABC transporter permease [Clostridiales bacterium]